MTGIGTGRPPSAVELAERCSDALRDLARVTHPEDGAPGLAYPGDVHVALGLLARLAHELPEALEHLRLWLEGQVELGLVETGVGPGDQDGLARATGGLQDGTHAASRLAGELAATLTRAQTAVHALRQA